MKTIPTLVLLVSCLLGALCYSPDAKSCQHVRVLDPTAASGIYNISASGGHVQVFCEFNEDHGYAYVRNADSPIDIPFEKLYTNRSELKLKFRRGGSQYESIIHQLPQFIDEQFSVQQSTWVNYTEPRNMTEPYIYLGMIPASKIRIWEQQGYVANGHEYAFVNCDGLTNSYISFALEASAAMEEVNGNDRPWIIHSVNATVQIPEHQFYFRIEEHQGGCGTLYYSQGVALGLRFDLFPAEYDSCQDVYDSDTTASSGLYLISVNGGKIEVFCEFHEDYGYAYLKNVDRSVDIPIERLYTNKSEVKLKFRKGRSQFETVIQQLPQYRDEDFSVQHSASINYTGPTMNPPYIYLGMIPAAKMTMGNEAGYVANGNEYVFVNCNSDGNSYMSFALEESEKMREVDGNDRPWIIHSVNATVQIPKHQFFFRIQEHQGGCGIFYESQGVALGLRFDLSTAEYDSCQDVYDSDTTASSGLYKISVNGGRIEVFCEFHEDYGYAYLKNVERSVDIPIERFYTNKSEVKLKFLKGGSQYETVIQQLPQYRDEDFSVQQSAWVNYTRPTMNPPYIYLGMIPAAKMTMGNEAGYVANGNEYVFINCNSDGNSYMSFALEASATMRDVDGNERPWIIHSVNATVQIPGHQFFFRIQKHQGGCGIFYESQGVALGLRFDLSTAEYDSCQDVYDSDATASSGLYKISVNGGIIEVFCEFYEDYGYAYLKNVERSVDIPIERLHTNKSEVKLKFLKGGSQYETVIQQLPQYRDDYFSVQQSAWVNYIGPTMNPPYIYLGMIPAAKMTMGNEAGYVANGNEYVFINCNSDGNSYMSFALEASATMREVDGNERPWIIHSVNATVQIPKHQIFFRIQEHQGGCGIFYESQGVALGLRFDLYTAETSTTSLTTTESTTISSTTSLTTTVTSTTSSTETTGQTSTTTVPSTTSSTVTIGQTSTTIITTSSPTPTTTTASTSTTTTTTSTTSSTETAGQTSTTAVTSTPSSTITTGQTSTTTVTSTTSSTVATDQTSTTIITTSSATLTTTASISTTTTTTSTTSSTDTTGQTSTTTVTSTTSSTVTTGQTSTTTIITTSLGTPPVTSTTKTTVATTTNTTAIASTTSSTEAIGQTSSTTTTIRTSSSASPVTSTTTTTAATSTTTTTASTTSSTVGSTSSTTIVTTSSSAAPVTSTASVTTTTTTIATTSTNSTFSTVAKGSSITSTTTATLMKAGTAVASTPVAKTNDSPAKFLVSHLDVNIVSTIDSTLLLASSASLSVIQCSVMCSHLDRCSKATQTNDLKCSLYDYIGDSKIPTSLEALLLKTETAYEGEAVMGEITLYETQLGYEEAKDECEEEGKRLATPKTKEALKLLNQIAERRVEHAWIGVKNNGGGDVVYADGEKVGENGYHLPLDTSTLSSAGGAHYDVMDRRVSFAAKTFAAYFCQTG